MIAELVQVIGLGLVLLLPLANPLTTIALFISLTSGMSRKERNALAKKIAFYVFCIMSAAYYVGQLLMDTFGISIPGLRIAGGMIVAFIGFKMLFPVSQPRGAGIDTRPDGDIAFVPLAMPSTVGPGTIAMIISSVSAIKSSALELSTFTIMVAAPLIFTIISTILWLSLRGSDKLVKIIGKNGIDVVSRLMGFLLVCMGVQFIINGVMELIQTYP